MAEQLEPTGLFRPTPNRYPWDHWLNGKVWHVQPEDYAPVPPTSFRTNAYQVARRRLTSVAVSIHPSGVITLQAYPIGEDRPVMPGAPGPNGRARPSTGQAAPQSGALPDPAKAADPYHCRHCGRPLTPAGAEAGECRKIADPTYRCPEHPNHESETR